MLGWLFFEMMHVVPQKYEYLKEQKYNTVTDCSMHVGTVLGERLCINIIISSMWVFKKQKRKIQILLEVAVKHEMYNFKG